MADIDGSFRMELVSRLYWADMRAWVRRGSHLRPIFIPYVVPTRVANAEGRSGTSFRFWDAAYRIKETPQSLDPKMSHI
jgi:hypothetical protein